MTTPQASGAARALFEEIVSDPLGWLDRALEDGREESGRLDFKIGGERERNSIRQTGTGRITDHDRSNLAKVISGFANSDGGVCVWGVNCRKGTGKDDPDVVQSLDPIINCRRFLTDLQSATNEVVSGATGVEHVDFPGREGGQSGFVVTYVPKIDGAPIMALVKDTNCYFYRTGSSFLRMPPFMVADRFAVRPQPRLGFACKCEKSSAGIVSQGNPARYELTACIENTGRGIARFPALKLSLGRHLDISQYELASGGPGLPRRSQRGSNYSSGFYAGGADAVIYPDTMHDVTRILYAPGTHSEVPPDAELEIGFEVYCDGDSQRGTLKIPVTHLERGELFRAENN